MSEPPRNSIHPLLIKDLRFMQRVAAGDEEQQRMTYEDRGGGVPYEDTFASNFNLLSKTYMKYPACYEIQHESNERLGRGCCIGSELLTTD